MNHAALVTVRNPFHPSIGRVQRDIAVGSRLGEFALKGDTPFVILLNGTAVLRKDWDTEVSSGDIVAVIALPRGGKKGGGSNPLQVVLLIAVAIVAPYIATQLFGEMVLSGAMGGLGFNIATAAIGFIGSSLVNAVFAGAGGSPSGLSSQKTADMAAPSPTYSIGAQGNIARLEQAIPVQYGRVNCFPDFAAMPYLEYAGNEQYLYQLFCIGAGDYDIESIRIEDTLISNFAEVEYQIGKKYSPITLFPTSVETSNEVAGQEMFESIYVGPFVACAAGKQTQKLSLDFVFPRGLYYADNNGNLQVVTIYFDIEYRTIDDAGAPTGPWGLSTGWYYWGNTSTPQRFSAVLGVPLARYEVRVIRTTAKNLSSRYGNDIVWAGMRAYYAESISYMQDFTLLAVKMRATNNLSNQSSRKINVTCRRKLAAWNGSTFGTPAATSSIAWALADVCKNTDYGAGLADTKIDLDGLLALDAVWAARGDEFNGRFDNGVSFWEAITKIARAGRAMPFMQGGIIRFARDQSAATPVALFSMRNIAKGSFSVQYITPHEAQADAVDANYFDANVWAPRRVMGAVPGSSKATPVKIDLFGITSRDQAFREAIYEAACNRYRRKIIKFTTEMEGFIPSYGDVVAISHDMPQWGQSAEVVAWDAGTKVLTINEVLTWGVGTHYIGLRKFNGGLDGPIVVTAGATPDKLVLATLPSFTPYVGQEAERTHIVFGWAETWRQPARVISVRPRTLSTVDIECVNEDENVHTSESGQVAPTVAYSQLPNQWTAPIVTGLLAQGVPNDPYTMSLSWNPAPGAEGYYVEQSGDAGDVWYRVAETRTPYLTTAVLFNELTYVRVAAYGLALGAWVTMDYGPTFNATLIVPPAAVSSFSATIVDGQVLLEWAPNSETDFANYIIRHGEIDWASSAEVATLSATRLILAANWTGPRTFRIKAVDSTGHPSDADTSDTLTISAPDAPVLTAALDAENVALSWTVPASTLPIVHYDLRYGETWGGGTPIALVASTSYRQKSDWIDGRTYWVAAIDAAGNAGAADDFLVTVNAPSAPVGFTAEVIDNNVLMRWSAPTSGDLPVATYSLRKGNTWVTADEIGTKAGLFTSVFETQGGDYVYWIAAIDSRGNEGTPVSVAVSVNSPPDYVLRTNWTATFAGTKSNAITDGTRILLLVNATETFADHFINNAWTTPQNQIDAGWPLYIQPTVASAYYEETFDYGAVLAADKITLATATNIITGAATITTRISVSPTGLGGSWIDYDDVTQVYATNFRYVKIRVTADAVGSGLVELTSMTVRIDSKLKTITGMADCLAADSGGTTIYLTDDRTSTGTKTFIDVDAITLTVAGTTPLIAIYDFSDVADPLSFKILLFTTGGARSDGTCSYTVRGF